MGEQGAGLLTNKAAHDRVAFVLLLVAESCHVPLVCLRPGGAAHRRDLRHAAVESQCLWRTPQT